MDPPPAIIGTAPAARMAALLLVMGAQMLPHAAVKLHFHEPVVLSGSFPSGVLFE